MPCKEGKTWRGIVYVGKAKVKQKRGFRTKREALAWESREKKEILRSQRVSQGITLQSFCIDYLDYSLRFSEKTYQEKRILCKQILKAWGSDCPVGSITPKMVLSFLQSRAAETSGHAYNKAHKNLRAMWRWGQKILQLSENPVAEIDPMPWDSTPHEMPSLESVVRILMAATREERVFLNAYLMTGARRSEILRWRWDLDINFQGRAYRLGTRKTRDGSMKYEWFPMPDELYEELWWWYQNRPVKDTPYVFVSTAEGGWRSHWHGKPFKFRAKFIKHLCERAGVKPFGYHGLRAFYASILNDQKKLPIKTIQRLLGHASPNTTERYLRSLNLDLRDAVRDIGSIFRSGDAFGDTNLETVCEKGNKHPQNASPPESKDSEK